MCDLFVRSFVFLLLGACFFDWFRRQATIRCYMRVFLAYRVSDAVRMVLLLGFADRSPLVARCVFVFCFLLCYVHGFSIGRTLNV